MTMTAGFALFFDALRQLWQRRAEALRIAAIPVITLLIFDLICWQFPETDWLEWLATVVWFLIPAWIAVNWHRCLLLDERPVGMLPKWRGRLIISYSALGLGLMILPAVLVAAVFLGADYVTDWSDDFDSLFLFFAIMIMWMVLALYFFFRLGLVLPHLALSRGWLGLGRSWHQTKGMGGGLWVISVLNTLILFVPAVPWFLLEAEMETLSGVLAISLITVLTTLIDINLLTQIYDYAMNDMAIEHGDVI